MLTFYLIRHGAKEAIPFDPPLTKVGHKQAELTAEFLKGVPFKHMIASTKLRTRQTAEAIAKLHNFQMSTDERLIERLEWENSETLDEFLKEWSRTDMDRSYQPKIGNSSVQKGFLMKQVIEELSDKYIEGNVLIVTHGGAIGDLLRNLFGDEAVPHRIDPKTGAPHIQLLECSITKIQKSGTEYKLLDVNNTSHLPVPVI